MSTLREVKAGKPRKGTWRATAALVGAACAVVPCLGCSVRVDYFATNGSVFVQEDAAPLVEQMLHTVQVSGARDLGCRADALLVRRVPHEPPSEYASNDEEFTADGCRQRGTYKVPCVYVQSNYVQCRAVLLARFPMDTGPSAPIGDPSRLMP